MPVALTTYSHSIVWSPTFTPVTDSVHDEGAAVEMSRWFPAPGQP